MTTPLGIKYGWLAVLQRVKKMKWMKALATELSWGYLRSSEA